MASGMPGLGATRHPVCNGFFSAEALDNQQEMSKVAIRFALPGGPPRAQVIPRLKKGQAQKAGCVPLAWNVGILAPWLRDPGQVSHLRKKTMPEGLSWGSCGFRVGSPQPSALNTKYQTRLRLRPLKWLSLEMRNICSRRPGVVPATIALPVSSRHFQPTIALPADDPGSLAPASRGKTEAQTQRRQDSFPLTP